MPVLALMQRRVMVTRSPERAWSTCSSTRISSTAPSQRWRVSAQPKAPSALPWMMQRWASSATACWCSSSMLPQSDRVVGSMGASQKEGVYSSGRAL